MVGAEDGLSTDYSLGRLLEEHMNKAEPLRQTIARTAKFLISNTAVILDLVHGIYGKHGSEPKPAKRLRRGELMEVFDSHMKVVHLLPRSRA